MNEKQSLAYLEPAFITKSKNEHRVRFNHRARHRPKGKHSEWDRRLGVEAILAGLNLWPVSWPAGINIVP